MKKYAIYEYAKPRSKKTYQTEEAAWIDAIKKDIAGITTAYYGNTVICLRYGYSIKEIE